MVRRGLSYAAAVGAVFALTAALGLAAWALRIDRIETFLLVFVLLSGGIAWRLGRGPAVGATVAFALVADYFFLWPHFGSGLATVRCASSRIARVLGRGTRLRSV